GRMRAALGVLGGGAPPHWSQSMEFLPAQQAWQSGDLKESLRIVDAIAASAERRPAREIRSGTGAGLIFWYLTLGRASSATRVANHLDDSTAEGQQYAGFRALVSDVVDDHERLRHQLEVDSGEAAPMFVRAGLPEQARRMIRRG